MPSYFIPLPLHWTGRASERRQKARHDGILFNPSLAWSARWVGCLRASLSPLLPVTPQLGVAERGDASDAGARDYTIGIAKDKEGNVECDPTFYLIATSGLYRGEIPEILVEDLSTNWIGYIAVGPYVDDVAKRDIVVAFRGTQVLRLHCLFCDITTLLVDANRSTSKLCAAAMCSGCASRALSCSLSIVLPFAAIYC